MKIASWNVNGMQSVLRKDRHGRDRKKTERKGEKSALKHFLDEEEPDVLCLQEVRVSSSRLEGEESLFRHFPTYKHCWANCATRKGYAGTAVLSKHEPLRVFRNFEFIDPRGEEVTETRLTEEGRVLTLEFSTWFCVCVYTPFSGQRRRGGASSKLRWRIQDWEPLLRVYLEILLETGKGVVAAGDFNATASPLDTSLPYTPPVLLKERQAFQLLLSSGLRDSLRELHPGLVKYSWPQAKAVGEARVCYRLDYVLTGGPIEILESDILDYKGSDHRPVVTRVRPPAQRTGALETAAVKQNGPL